jgi:hypothetical protein
MKYKCIENYSFLVKGEIYTPYVTGSFHGLKYVIFERYRTEIKFSVDSTIFKNHFKEFSPFKYGK